MRATSFSSALLVAIALVFAAPAVRAGGPFYVDSNKTGVPLHWKNSAFGWYADKGRLSGAVTHDAAVAMVREAIGKWVDAELENASRQKVKTAKFSSEYLGPTDDDITAENYQNYYDDSTKTYIVFDEDGSITAAVYGEENKDSTVGLSTPTDADGLSITRGIIILNGSLLTAGTLTADQFKAAILHELGHLFNLDHSQVNYDIAKDCKIDQECDGSNFVPTMYPSLISELQYSLTYDDVIAFSSLYPSSKFSSEFSTITGAVYDNDGKPLKGVNVLAVRAGEGDEMAQIDARSMVSGVMYPGYSGDSKFYLRGLTPGKKYQVYAEPIADEFRCANHPNCGSGFEPVDEEPTGFDRLQITTPDGETTVTAPDAGAIFEMAAATIGATGACEGSSCPTAGSSKACALMPAGVFDAASMLCLLFAGGAMGLRRWIGARRGKRTA